MDISTEQPEGGAEKEGGEVVPEAKIDDTKGSSVDDKLVDKQQDDGLDVAVVAEASADTGEASTNGVDDGEKEQEKEEAVAEEETTANADMEEAVNGGMDVEVVTEQEENPDEKTPTKASGTTEMAKNMDLEEDNEAEKAEETMEPNNKEMEEIMAGNNKAVGIMHRSPMFSKKEKDNTTDDDDDDDMRSEKTESRMPSDEGEGEEGDSKASPIPSHLPDYLDRSTLNSIKKYLSNFEARPHLEDDDVLQLMLKTDRNVEHRARYYSNPLDDLVDEDQMYKDFYQEEEFFSVGHDFMKGMSKQLQATRRRGVDKRTMNWVKQAAGLKRKDYHSPHSALGRDDEDSDDNDGTRKSAPRRYTRGMARTTRIKKKEEFIFMDNLGLKSLLDAIEEMEPQAGPYPVPFECAQQSSREKRGSEDRVDRSKKRPIASFSKGSDDDDLRRFDPALMRPLVARISEEDSLAGLARGDDFFFGENRDILVTQVLVNGQHVEEDEEDKMSLMERKRELKRLRDRQYQKRRRDRKLEQSGTRKRQMLGTPIRSNSKRSRDHDSATEDDEAPRRRKSRSIRGGKNGNRRQTSARPLRGPVSLPLLDWQRRQMWSPRKKPRREIDVDTSRNVEIPETLKKWGVSYRLPAWESVNPAPSMSDQANYVEPVRRRHADDVYGAWAHNLINLLNGSARSWAIHEFFYSDLDRPWYSINTLAIEVAKLGISPSARLTRREWSVVRRMIHRRPRRFSKRFIYSQLKERNNYRNMVRHLQRHPDEANNTGFDIPAPIRVGATVTAYNKRFLILHRGVILFHDVYSDRYLVQFERQELGFQFCSDTEVASHGVPNILMKAVPHRLSDSPHKADTDGFFEGGTQPYGTSFASLPAISEKETISCETELVSLLTKPSAAPQIEEGRKEATARASLIEKVAERETLVALLSALEVATTRKERLLNMMDKFNCLLVDRLGFGGGAPSNHVISDYFEGHYAWLEANLKATNESLDRAMAYLKVMYSGAYSTTSPSSKAMKSEVMQLFIETSLAEERRFGGGPPAEAVHWIAALYHGSHDVGSYLATLVDKEDTTSDNEKSPNDSNSNPSHPDNEFLRQRVAAAGSVLSAVGYCCGRSSENDITMPNGDVPFVDVVLASGLNNLQMPEVSDSDRHGVVRDALAERASAEEELKDSLRMLGKEFTGLAFASRSDGRPKFNIPDEETTVKEFNMATSPITKDDTTIKETETKEEEEEEDAFKEPSIKSTTKKKHDKIRKDVQDKIMRYYGLQLQMDRKDVPKQELLEVCEFKSLGSHGFFYAFQDLERNKKWIVKSPSGEKLSFRLTDAGRDNIPEAWP